MVQQEATLGGGDLPGVALAHCHDAVRSDNGALHDVDGLALVELVGAHVLREHPLKGTVPVCRHPELSVGCGGLHSLVHKVVDGQDGAGVVVHTVGAVAGRDIAAHHTGVPVVGHKDTVVAIGEARRAAMPVSTYVEVERSLASGHGQKAEAELVVPKGAVVVAVGVAGAVEAGVVHKHKVDIVDVLVEVPHALVATDAEVEGHAGTSVLETGVAAVCGSVHVPGCHNHHAVPPCSQSHGEGAGHISQAAGLAPWRDLRRHKHDVHNILGHLLLAGFPPALLGNGAPLLGSPTSGDPYGGIQLRVEGGRLGIDVRAGDVLSDLGDRGHGHGRGLLHLGYLRPQVFILCPQLLYLFRVVGYESVYVSHAGLLRLNRYQNPAGRDARPGSLQPLPGAEVAGGCGGSSSWSPEGAPRSRQPRRGPRGNARHRDGEVCV
mmetsp:Transcript_38187/g.107899  ORF Transcript_38187/g.107899 Transcript_38187/m.107899 type:complete len:435 (+) Transcript_38187:1132-2436(+)